MLDKQFFKIDGAFIDRKTIQTPQLELTQATYQEKITRS